MLIAPLLAGLIAASPAPGNEEAPPICVGANFVYFKPGSASLTPLAKEILDNYLALLNMSKFPSRVEITGNADRVGRSDTNVRLSRRRAEAVRTYLSAHGFPRDHIVVESAGEDKPLVETADGVAEAQNRYAFIFEHLAAEEDARRDAIWARIPRPSAVC